MTSLSDPNYVKPAFYNKAEAERVAAQPANVRHVAEAGKVEHTLGEVAQKRCTKCGEKKTLDAFALARNGLLGRQSWCKDCTNTHQRALYAAGRRGTRQRPFKSRIPAKAKEQTIIMSTKHEKVSPTTRGTAAWISKGARVKLAALRDRIGVTTLSAAMEFAIDVAGSNAAAIQIEKARAEVATAQEKLKALVETAASTATQSVAGKKSKTNGHSPPCTVRSCERPARGGYKLCYYHRLKAREQNHRRMAKLKRAAAKAEARQVVVDHTVAGVG